MQRREMVKLFRILLSGCDRIIVDPMSGGCDGWLNPSSMQREVKASGGYGCG